MYYRNYGIEKKINGLLKMKKKGIDKMHKKGKVKSIELLMM